MLVFTGIELIFFTAECGAVFLVYAESGVDTTEIFHHFRVGLTQGQGFFCPSQHPTSEEAGAAQRAGREAGRRRRKGECLK